MGTEKRILTGGAGPLAGRLIKTQFYVHFTYQVCAFLPRFYRVFFNAFPFLGRKDPPNHQEKAPANTRTALLL